MNGVDLFFSSGFTLRDTANDLGIYGALAEDRVTRDDLIVFQLWLT